MTNASPVVLQAIGLTKNYGALSALQTVDLTVRQGERLVILGPNGAGKSTLLNVLAGEIEPSSGHVELFSQTAQKMTIDQRVRMGLRRTFQHSQLLANMSVEQHLALALQAYERAHWSWRSALSVPRKQSVKELAQRCHIAHLLSKYAGELSHGERRQLELAMSMGGQVRLLLLDEPAAGLSPAERVWLKDWIVNLDRGITVLLIEHDMDVALSVADNVVVMQNGTVVFRGDVAQVVNDTSVHEIYLGSYVHQAGASQ